MGPKRTLGNTHALPFAVVAAGTAIAAVVCAIGVGKSLSIRVEEVRVEAPGLPGSGAPLRILQISDLHSRTGLGMNRAVAGLLNKLPGDLLVMTGDFKLPGGSAETAVEGGALVAAAVSERMPVYAVRGNNDPAEIMPKLASRGIRVLDNESTEFLSGIWLVGWNPYPRVHPSLGRILHGIPDGAYVILLSHSPDVILEGASGRAQLVLSGHTHGGQIRFPGMRPVVTLTRLSRAYFQGLHLRVGGQLYINRGIGTSIVPLRIFAPPEITVLTLVPTAPHRQNPLN